MSRKNLVRDIMSHDLITVLPSDDLVYALQLLSDHGIHRLPVVRPIEGRGEVELVGMVSDRDLRLAANSPYIWGTSEEVIDALHQLRVADVMTTELQEIFPNATVTTAAEAMLDSHVGGLPVVEQEEGRRFLTGIVTRTDLLGYLIEQEARGA